jgi:hypothetical protein
MARVGKEAHGNAFTALIVHGIDQGAPWPVGGVTGGKKTGGKTLPHPRVTA